MFPRGLFAGLPWQCGASFNAAAAKTLKIPYWHDWLFGGPVKMLWQCTPSTVAATPYSKGRFYLLGNEPEAADQSNTPPANFVAAVKEWRRNSYAVPGILWNGGGTQGARWFRDYILAGGPVNQFVHLHIYAHTGLHWRQLWGDLKAWLAAKLIGGVKVIVSEAAAWPQEHESEAENSLRQKSVMDAIVQTLRSDTQLHSVFWFSGCCKLHMPYWTPSDLLDLDGTRTPLGNYFLMARQELAGTL